MFTPPRVRAASGCSCWERYCPEAPKTCVSSGVWMMCWICPIAPAAMDGPVALLFGLLRSVNPEVGQSGFIGIAASVVDNVAVDVIQQLTALPVCRDLPDDAPAMAAVFSKTRH